MTTALPLSPGGTTVPSGPQGVGLLRSFGIPTEIINNRFHDVPASHDSPMSLIHQSLKLVKQRMNETFSNRYPRSEEWVILSNIVDPDGNLFEDTRNKVVMVLANIQHETIISTYNRTVPNRTDTYSIVTPPLYIDLFVLFYANFFDRNYGEGLTMISETISFFQQYPVFTQDTLPGLDPVIDKLRFEMVNLAVSDLNYLMGMMSAKYLPSVYFKVRLLPFQSDAIRGEVPAVQGLETSGNP